MIPRLIQALPFLLVLVPATIWGFHALLYRGEFLPEPKREASPLSSALVLYALRKKEGKNVPT